jgi:hypothetical protein
MYIIFHNWNEVKRWPEVAGNYLERGCAAAVESCSDLRRPAVDLPKVGGARFLGWWASRSMGFHRLVWPEFGNPSRAKSFAVASTFKPDSGRFRRWFAVIPVGDGRGGGGESIGTGGRPWGGRTVKIRPVNGRQRGRGCAGRERVGGRGERKIRGVSFSGNPKYPKRKLSKNTLQLPLTITFAYELRFMRTSCLRTRFDELYNFREENFLKFSTDQKSNFEPLKTIFLKFNSAP